MKFIKNNEAILILIENSHYDEAFTIFRLSFEHLVNVFALIRDEEYLEEIINNSCYGLSKTLNQVGKNINRDNLTEENKEKLNTSLKDDQENPVESLGYSIFNAANKSEMKNLYDSVYRKISTLYAHSNFIQIISNQDEDDYKELLVDSVSFMKIANCLIKDEIL